MNYLLSIYGNKIDTFSAYLGTTTDELDKRRGKKGSIDDRRLKLSKQLAVLFKSLPQRGSLKSAMQFASKASFKRAAV